MMHFRDALQFIRDDGQAVAVPWARLLRANCEALHQLPPGLTSAVSVSVRLSDCSAHDAETLAEVSRLFAEEYGFTVDVHINGRGATVRFGRPEGSPA
jgi:hypothetical protein